MPYGAGRPLGVDDATGRRRPACRLASPTPTPTPVAGGAAGRTAAREELEHRCWRRAPSRSAAGQRRLARGARPVAHVLRARSRPHPPRPGVPPPGRQDAGLRLPRRPPAHPAHPRPRGRPGRHVGGPGARPQRRPHRGIALGHDCGHGPGGHASEDALSPYVPGGYDHAVWGADVTLAPLNLCAETLDGVRNHSWSRPAPSTPEGEVVSGPTASPTCATTSRTPWRPASSPPATPERRGRRCGSTRSRQLGSFITAMVEAAADTGGIGMTDAADALAEFRRLQLRPRTCARPAGPRPTPGRAAPALVEHYGDRPHLLPEPARAAGGSDDAVAGRRRLRGRDDRPLRLPPGRPSSAGPRQAPSRRSCKLSPPDKRRSHCGSTPEAGSPGRSWLTSMPARPRGGPIRHQATTSATAASALEHRLDPAVGAVGHPAETSRAPFRRHDSRNHTPCTRL